MISTKLNERRDAAASECSNCLRCETLAPGSVACKWTGEAKIIPLSVGKCPDDRWDHSSPIGKSGPSQASESVQAPPGGISNGVRPIPRDTWSAVMLVYFEKRVDGEIGLGDTLSRLGGDIANPKDAAALGVLLVIAKGIACKSRVMMANRMLPYSPEDFPAAR